MATVEEIVRVGVEKRAETIRAMDVGYRTMQRDRLLSILRQNADTEFGRAHGFASIQSVEEYQRQVPPSTAADYETAWKRIAAGEQDVLFRDPVHAFGLSSGTTGEAKLVPLAKGLIRGLKRAIAYATSAAIARSGNYSLLRGYALQMAAPSCVRRILGDIPVGYITGIIGAARTYPFHNIGLPPVEVLDLMEWEEKYRIVEEQYADHDVRMIVGVPTYIQGLLRRILPRRARPLWPNLSLIVTSGVGLEPHREPLAAAFPRAEFREMYLATEAAVGFQPAPEPGLMPMVEDLFLEFVPEERWGAPGPPRIRLGETENNVRYVPLVTTPSGLYAYSLGDIVRFVQRDPPRLVVVGRQGSVLNLATEKLEAGQAEQVLRAAGLATEAFLVCPQAPPALGHEWVLEFRGDVSGNLQERIERAFREVSPLYRHLRAGAGLLAPAQVTVVREGAFDRALARRPGQGKILRIYTNRAVRDEIVADTCP